jgi:AcrR family transcriptional regulator
MNAGDKAFAVERTGRGRPPKLTVPMIVAAARDLLGRHAPDDVTCARVAAQLGVPTSSLYNHFPNRDMLIAAVAADMFSDFVFSDPGEAVPWQQRLRAWLAETDRFFAHNPVAFRVMATSGQASPAWISVRASLLGVLQSLGFEGRDLALVHAWCESQVTGLLLVENYAGPNRLAAAGPPRVPMDMDSAAAQADVERRRHLPSVRRDEIMAIGFDAIIAQLERLAQAHDDASAGDRP